MRIWSLHPSHLDRMGLVACWRETLLAQAVLDGRTRGYHAHPQLERFRAQPQPIAAIGAYLGGLARNARERGYRFDESLILRPGETGGSAEDDVPAIAVSSGQLDYEWEHLGRKLRERSPTDARRWADEAPTPHPLFRVVPGSIEAWERPSQSPQRGARSPRRNDA